MQSEPTQGPWALDLATASLAYHGRHNRELLPDVTTASSPMAHANGGARVFESCFRRRAVRPGRCCECRVRGASSFVRGGVRSADTETRRSCRSSPGHTAQRIRNIGTVWCPERGGCGARVAPAAGCRAGRQCTVGRVHGRVPRGPWPPRGPCAAALARAPSSVYGGRRAPTVNAPASTLTGNRPHAGRGRPPGSGEATSQNAEAHSRPWADCGLRTLYAVSDSAGPRRDSIACMDVFWKV
jgi:hypothetical protein